MNNIELEDDLENKIEKLHEMYEKESIIKNNLKKEEMLVTYDDFEFSEKKQNPFLVRNLLNNIYIVNLLWRTVKNDVKKFHKYLLQFNIKFSVINNNNTKIFVITCLLNNKIMLNIIENQDSFPEWNKNQKIDYLNNLYLTRKTIKDYILEQFSLLTMFNDVDNNIITIFPNCIFYIKKEVIENKLKGIFTEINFNKIKIKNINENIHYGFNELDFILKLKENVIIKPTNAFNVVSKELKYNYLKENIIFPKDTLLFFEFKTSTQFLKSDIEQLKDKSKLFFEVFRNDVIQQLNWEKLNKYNYYYVYDTDREDGFKGINTIKKKDNFAVIYSSPGKILSLLVNISYNNSKEILKLKDKDKQLEDKYKQLENKYKLEMEEIKLKLKEKELNENLKIQNIKDGGQEYKKVKEKKNK